MSRNDGAQGSPPMSWEEAWKKLGNVFDGLALTYGTERVALALVEAAGTYRDRLRQEVERLTVPRGHA